MTSSRVIEKNTRRRIREPFIFPETFLLLKGEEKEEKEEEEEEESRMTTRLGASSETATTTTAARDAETTARRRQCFGDVFQPSSSSSPNKRRKFVALVCVAILFLVVVVLFGAFEVLSGAFSASLASSTGAWSNVRGTYGGDVFATRKNTRKGKGEEEDKGEDEEVDDDDDDDDDAIETNTRDRREKTEGGAHTLSESDEREFQSRLSSASEKCLRAPYPQVLGDNGETLKRAQTNMKEFEMKHGNVKDMVSENKKRWRAEGSPGKEIAKTGRRRSRQLLAYARSHPLEQKCRGERRYRASKYGRSTAHKHLKDCMNRLEDCMNVDDARKTAKSMPGVKLLTQNVNNKIACLTVSKKCNPRAMKLGDNKETGMHITGKIETMKEDVRRDYKTCALVGNGPGLRADGVADAIDRHEAVFRFNAYNLGQREGKMQDNNTHFAGTKQTFRMFNKKRSIIPEIWGLKPAPEGETWLFWHYGSAMYYKAANAANPQNVYFLSVPAINHEIDSYFAIRKDVAELGLGKNYACPTNLPTGLHAIMLATMMCDVVNLFGFSYDMKMLESRKDTTSPRVSSSHAWGVDTAMLRLLHLSDAINLCTV